MKHLHQLTTAKLVELIHKIHSKQATATVKEDGVALTVGVTSDGQRYISREGKEGTGTQYFCSADIPDVPQFTPFKVAAAIWFNAHGRHAIRHCWGGDSWNVEVTYPGLNVIMYDDVRMTFLEPRVNTVRGVMSTDPSELVTTVKYDISYPHFSSHDGRTIQRETRGAKASVCVKQTVPVPDVSHIVTWLASPYDGGTIADALTINLSKVKKADRPAIETHRAYFASSLRRMITKLTTPTNCEGIVIDSGGKLVKIVPAWFVQVNQLQHAVRNCIKQRTFGSDFRRYVTRYIPECPVSLIDDIHQLWKIPATADRNAELSSKLVELRTLYLTAHNSRPIQKDSTHWTPTGAVHNSTLVEFASFIEQLAAEPVNTL